MLNENNQQVQSETEKTDVKEIMTNRKQEDSSNIEIIEQDMHDQESSFKIRLLKRQHKTVYKVTIDLEKSQCSTIEGGGGGHTFSS